MEQDKQWLCSPFEEADVKTSMWQIGGVTKPLGQMGFPANSLKITVYCGTGCV